MEKAAKTSQQQHNNSHTFVCRALYEMELELLLFARWFSSKTWMERLQFDELFKKYFGNDTNLEVLNAFAVIRDKGVLSSLALDITDS